MKNIDECFSFKNGFCKQAFFLSIFLSFSLSVIGAVFFFCLTTDASAESLSESSPPPVLQLVPVSEPPSFGDDLDFAYLKESISGSIAYYRKLPLEKQFSFGKDMFTTAHLIRSMERFLAFIEKQPSQKELNAFIDQYYQVYAYMQNSRVTSVLFTGYYEPVLYGSPQQTDTFRYPVYSRPDDLVTYDRSGGGKGKGDIGRKEGNNIVPYFTRQQIEERGITGMNASPIAWVNDPVALFFLQIQGSGKISLENDRHEKVRTINVHYQISNGHPYKSIGKYLIDKKKLSKETVSMQSIREYLNIHPDEVDDIFNYNPRYIFFETVEKGPLGCFNIELTPGRSVALDRQIAPAGALVFIQTQKPEVDLSGKIQTWNTFSRFLLNQDTGSAIKGPGRADIFWGSGPYAELAAGYMKHPGNLFYLVLKSGY